MDISLGLSHNNIKRFNHFKNHIDKVVHSNKTAKYCEFTNSGSYIDCGYDSSLSFEYDMPFSISCWINISSGSSVNNYILGKSSQHLGYFLYLNTSEQIVFKLSNTSVQRIIVEGDTVLSTDTWYHVAISYDGNGNGNGINIYLDSVLESMTIDTDNLLSNTIENNDEPFTIGDHRASVSTPTLGHLGFIDEISIWNKELSQSEITQIYNKGIISTNYKNLDFTSNCISHWDLGETMVFGGTNWTSNNIADNVKHLEFDAANSLTIPGSSASLNHIHTTTDFAISFWWKPVGATNGTLKPLFGNASNVSGSGFYLYQSGGGNITCIVVNGSNKLNVSSLNTIDIDRWYHVVVTCDDTGTHRGVFVDKVLGASGSYGTPSGGTALGSADIRMNSYGSSNSQINNLDKVAFFDSGLTAGQVNELYNLGRINGDYSSLSFYDNLIDYYEMDSIEPESKLGILSTCTNNNGNTIVVKDMGLTSVSMNYEDIKPTETISTFGSLSGSTKWFGGVLAPNGIIYGIPSSSQTVLKIDTNTDTATTIGSLESGSNKWSGGVLAPNGCIYGMPGYNEDILKIDTKTEKISKILLGDSLLAKWSGGVLAPNGYIYGIPHNSTTILKIDTKTDEISTFGSFTLNGNKWVGGTLDTNGKIYCAPSGVDDILIIDTNNDTTSLIESVPSSFSSGVLAPNGCIYMVPRNNTSVLKINPKTNTTEELTNNIPSDNNKWRGAAISAEGIIYAGANSTNLILRIDTNTDQVTTFSTTELDSSSSKYQSIVSAPNGSLYMIPLSENTVLKIDPQIENNLSENFLLSAYSNKL